MADKVVERYKAGDEKYDHLDATEMEKVSKLIGEKRTWMDESCAILNALDKTTNPPILAVQFFTEKQAFEAIANPIINRSKPKPPKQDPPAASEGGEKKAEEKPAAEGAADPAAAAAPKEGEAVNGSQPQEGGNMDLD